MGINVFQPFGYDAFGLPAENYARKVGGDPRDITYQNIDNFRKQMDVMNSQYEEKLITSDPSYYKWSQFIFKKLKEHNLAYKKEGEVNYCDSCETVLANEQVKHDKCERCNSDIQTKILNQWYFKITEYKDRLIKNLDGLDYPKGTIKQQRDWLETLQDWCVSRQRSWGTPIPLEGETDTLDTFVDSSFYYLRYLTKNEDELIPDDDYRQVDVYVGGAEHACMHLIYARFIHMFLYDIGLVPVEEPFKKVVHQGMITKDGNKMSKSKGNVVDPNNYNQDELRLYLMFIGPYFDGGDWSDQHITGVRKFISRFSRWIEDATECGEDISYQIDSLGDMINKYNENFKFNTIVSSFMSFHKKNKSKQISVQDAVDLTEMFRCFCPNFLTGVE